ncbi:hypothetical protein Q0M94_28150 (plasmid) [Deinococcus radiomollis]|uniref:hypothetical protein n=1 Tax=Deinococcus radiomollis TaxID=468916 RepID=UPI003891EE32
MTYTLTIDNQALSIQPDTQHEYLMTTEQVALGYGVTQENIRQHKLTKADELIEGKHYLSSVSNPNAGNLQREQTLWTKRGIVRLGFFIRSARARKFRDMAEDLVIEKLEPTTQHAALISARMIGESTGQSNKAVWNSLKRYGPVLPVAEYREPYGNSRCFLYPLAEVAAAYEANNWALIAPFQPHTGPVQPLSTAPVSRLNTGQPRAAQRLPAPGRPEAARLLLETSRQLTQLALALLDEH